MIAIVTAGTIGGLVLLVIGLALVCFAVAWALIDAPDGFLFVDLFGCAVLLVIVFAFWWWGMAFTLSPNYHSWNTKTGVVSQVSSRIVKEDSGASQRFVVVLNGQPYGIDDTRAALLKVGDRVTLRCKKEFQWGVPRDAQGWACNWG